MNDDEIKEQQEFSEVLTHEYDLELFKYELAVSKGVLEGIKIQQLLREEWLNKKLPILIIAFIKGIKVVKAFNNFSINKGFYPYEKHEFNHLNLSGSFFTTSLNELEEIVRLVDVNKYEVSINFFCEDNTDFVERFPGCKDLLTYVDRLKEDNDIYINFPTLTVDYHNQMNTIHNLLYRHLTFHEN